MLKWLKEILGEGYTEEIDRQISAEIEKGFVSKADFSAAKEEMKKEKAAHELELTRLKIDAAVDQALTGAGAKNHTAVKALMTQFLKEAKLNEDGSVEGLSDTVKRLSEDTDTSFLFNGRENQKPLPGAVPAFPGRSGEPSAAADAPVII